MRIGVVTTSYPREPGDPAGGFVAGFARWLRDAGATVEVIAAGPGARVVEGIAVDRVGGRGIFYDGGAPDALAANTVGGWLRAARFSTELSARVAWRLPRWDAVVSHWVAPSGLAVEGVRLAQRRDIPHLAIAHSSDVTLLQRNIAGRAAFAAVARRADLVYASAHLVVDGAPGRVVAMGIDVAEVARGDRERTRLALGLTRRTVLFLGRLVPVKGVDRLLAALPPDVDLLIAGDGPLMPTLRRMAKELDVPARFLGEVRGVERANLLAAADLMVVPSRVLPDGRREGVPTVIFEALAAGLPVITTWAAGVDRILTDGVDVLLVEPEVGPLSAAIARLAADPMLRAQLAVCGRVPAALRDWSQVGPRLAGRLLEKLPSSEARTVRMTKVQKGVRSA